MLARGILYRYFNSIIETCTSEKIPCTRVQGKKYFALLVETETGIVTIILLSESESVKFSLIKSVVCLFTDSSVKKIFFTVKSVIFHC